MTSRSKTVKQSPRNRSSDALDEALNSLKTSATNLRVTVYEIHTKALWKKGGYTSFEALCETISDVQGRSTLYRNLTAAKVDVAIGCDIGTVPITLAEKLAKGKRSPRQIKEVWTQATKGLAENEQPSLKAIQNAIASLDEIETVITFLSSQEKFALLIERLPQKKQEKMHERLCRISKVLKQHLTK